MNGPAHVQIRIHERAIYLAKEYKNRKRGAWERLFGDREPEGEEIFPANQKRLFREIRATMTGGEFSPDIARPIYLPDAENRMAFTPEEVEEVAAWWARYYEGLGFTTDYSPDPVGLEINNGRILAPKKEETDEQA